MKKVGTAHRIRPMASAAASIVVPRRQAATSPASVPTMIARTLAGRISQSVLAIPCPSMSITGRSRNA